MFLNSIVFVKLYHQGGTIFKKISYTLSIRNKSMGISCKTRMPPNAKCNDNICINNIEIK